MDGCDKTGKGHEHLSMWQESVILVCEEALAGTPAQPAADTIKAMQSPLAITKYHLRRVTTLGWDCRLSAEPGPGHWLPFEPSLVHMRSVVCSVKGRSWNIARFHDPDPDPDPDPGPDPGPDERAGQDAYPNVFCDPVTFAGLLRWDEEWHKQWPVCKVYIV